MKFLVLVIGFFLTSPKIYAQTCEQAFGLSKKAQLGSHLSGKQNSNLARLLSSRAAERWKDEPAWQSLAQKIMDCDKPECFIQLETDRFKISMTKTLTTYSSAPSVLKLSIENFALKALDGTLQPLGSTPEFMSMSFFNLISMLVDTGLRLAEDNPAVRRLKFEGAFVVNVKLIQMLFSMGFSRRGFNPHMMFEGPDFMPPAESWELFVDLP